MVTKLSGPWMAAVPPERWKWSGLADRGRLGGSREMEVWLLPVLLSCSGIVGEVASQVCASAPPLSFAYLTNTGSSLE